MSEHHHDEHDHEHHHDHDYNPTDELVTVRDLIRYAVSRFNRAGLFFGHGLQDAYDEAVYLVLHSLHLPLDRLDPFLDACIPSNERSDVLDVIYRRADERVPAAYITQEAWLRDFRFYVDERVIVPRSFCAELLQEGLEPWISDDSTIESALDMCTGSGCLAILMAHRFAHAHIDAVDLSADALDVARRNVVDYELEERIELIESDVYHALAGRRYDLIISNPPYVTKTSMDALPAEYRKEPAMALDGGIDGMDIVQSIVRKAREHLTERGVLLLEVGHNRAEFERVFPSLPCVWLTTTSEEEKVLLLTAEMLQAL